jgi:hypothetical protein
MAKHKFSEVPIQQVVVKQPAQLLPEYPTIDQTSVKTIKIKERVKLRE